MKDYNVELRKVATSFLLKDRKLDKIQEKYNVSCEQMMMDLDTIKEELSLDILGY